MFKKLVLLLMVVGLLAFTAGCTTGVAESEPDMTGLIYAIDGSTILVVDGIEDVNVPYETWFENGNYAINFTVTSKTVINKGGETVDIKDLEKGMKVQVWLAGALAESYPAQGEAKRIVVAE